MVDYLAPGTVSLTEAGRRQAQLTSAAATHDEMVDALCAMLPGPQQRIIRALVNVYPEALPKGELAERAGASATSSSFTNNLGSLRSLGVIDYPERGYVAAEPVLFLEDAA